MIEAIQNSWYYADGFVRWKRIPASKKSNVGDPVAFSKKATGHLILSFWSNGKTHKFQYGRIVWMLVNGCLPDAEIDHKDRNPENNSIENLRLADRCENNWNRSLTCAQGVHKHGSSWRVEIVARKKKHRINGFSTKSDAVEFRKLMAEMLHGEFANKMSYKAKAKESA